MAFSFINGAVGTSVESDQLVINKPTDTANNDIMFAVVVTYVKTVSSAPTGWTALQSSDGASFYYYFYYKKASSEGSNYTWTLSSATNTAPNCGFIVTYRSGFSLADTLDTSNIARSAALSEALSGGNITVESANSCLVFLGITASASNKTITVPVLPVEGWAEDYEAVVQTDYSRAYSASLTWTGSGATDTVVATLSDNVQHKCGVVLSLNPSPTFTTIDTTTVTDANTSSVGRSYTTTDTVTSSDSNTAVIDEWAEGSKNSSSWTDTSKNASSWTDESKNSSSWTNTSK